MLISWANPITSARSGSHGGGNALYGTITEVEEQQKVLCTKRNNNCGAVVQTTAMRAMLLCMPNEKQTFQVGAHMFQLRMCLNFCDVVMYTQREK